MAAGDKAQRAVVLAVVRQEIVEVGRVGLRREGRHLELRPVAVDAGARLALPLQPAVAEAEDAARAKQILNEAERRRVRHHRLEHRIVPEHEAHQLLPVAEDFSKAVLAALLALAGDADEGVADGAVLFRRAHRVRRQYRETEGFEFGDVLEQVELLQLAIKWRQRLGGSPVLDLHGPFLCRGKCERQYTGNK